MRASTREGAPESRRARSDACLACLRRSWLLSELSGLLDRCALDRTRLLELLALPDAELIAALGGRRAGELSAAFERFEAPDVTRGRQHDPTICRHAHGYPTALSSPTAPHMLAVCGGADRLARLTTAPAVTILGSRAPSDYGRETARGLARGLAASGVTVVASLADGIAAAALAGVLEVRAGAVAVLSDGLGVACSPRLRPLRERIAHDGCAVSELPRDCAGRRWGALASARVVVGLGLLSVVVEARDTPGDLAAAVFAKALGRRVAAVPGRISSPLSRGAHSLLMDGASLVRGPRDVLELIYQLSPAEPGTTGDVQRCLVQAHAGLRRNLRAVLESVGTGCDTPDKLARAGYEARAVLPALSELELEGLLVRGAGGRYLPRNQLDQ
jgi:DNA processing protein